MQQYIIVTLRSAYFACNKCHLAIILATISVSAYSFLVLS